MYTTKQYTDSAAAWKAYSSDPNAVAMMTLIPGQLWQVTFFERVAVIAL